MRFLRWALITFLVSVVAAMVGLDEIARGAISISQLFFVLFLVVAFILLVIHIVV